MASSQAYAPIRATDGAEEGLLQEVSIAEDVKEQKSVQHEVGEPTDGTEEELLQVCIAEDAKDQKFVQHAVGPVVPLMRMVALFGLAFQCGFLILTWKLSKCDELSESDAGSQKSVTYPFRIWCIVALCLMVRWTAECWALRYYLPPYCKTVKEADGRPFSILGKKCSLRCWVVFYLGLSTLNFVDQAMDSASSATTLRLFHCQSHLSLFWTETWQQSLLRFLPVPSLDTLVEVSWLLTLPQIIVPVLLTWGAAACFCQLKYAVGDPGADKNWFGGNVWHVDVFEGLAEASGMVTFQQLAFVRATSRIDKHIKDNHENTAFKVVENALALSRNFTLRFLLVYVLENSLQANLQSTIWALNSVEIDIHTQMQMQNLLSITVTIVTSLAKLCEYLAFERLMDRVRNAAKDDTKPKTRDMLKRVRMFWLCSRSFAVILVLNLGYAFLKLISSGFLCHHATFNLNGCTRLD
mmetsp:Transcript_60843/g.172940  ORF Transcript_60843/g.172940 Transcript_60843/m.172940 type:complete len:467 (+) Transcript_60843:75-1475(+)